MFGRFFRDPAAGLGLAAIMLAVALAAVAWSDAAVPASDAINDELLVMAAVLFAVFGQKYRAPAHALSA